MFPENIRKAWKNKAIGLMHIYIYIKLKLWKTQFIQYWKLILASSSKNINLGLLFFHIHKIFHESGGYDGSLQLKWWKLKTLEKHSLNAYKLWNTIFPIYIEVYNFWKISTGSQKINLAQFFPIWLHFVFPFGSNFYFSRGSPAVSEICFDLLLI